MTYRASWDNLSLKDQYIVEQEARKRAGCCNAGTLDEVYTQIRKEKNMSPCTSRMLQVCTTIGTVAVSALGVYVYHSIKS
jgi:hypothetical protein